MLNQNECDHVIGRFRGTTITEWLMIYYCLKNMECKYNYCPNCGAKIDWDKFKEEVDDSNKAVE